RELLDLGDALQPLGQLELARSNLLEDPLPFLEHADLRLERRPQRVDELADVLGAGPLREAPLELGVLERDLRDRARDRFGVVDQDPAVGELLAEEFAAALQRLSQLDERVAA